MKRKQWVVVILAICMTVIMSSATSIAADASYYVIPGIGHQFALGASNGGTLSIWGSNIQAATGFSTLSVNSGDAPLEVIKSWYATLLSFRITGDYVRIIYDNASGKIKQISPQLQ